MIRRQNRHLDIERRRAGVCDLQCVLLAVQVCVQQRNKTALLLIDGVKYEAHNVTQRVLSDKERERIDHNTHARRMRFGCRYSIADGLQRHWCRRFE